MKSKDSIILTKILIYINELKDFIEGYNQETFKKTNNKFAVKVLTFLQ